MSRPRELLVVALAAAIAYALLAWSFGEDVNWDYQNYHAYDVFALLNLRYGQDIAPAGAHTFLNPFPYVPSVGLRRWLGPLAGSLCAAVLQSSATTALYALLRACCSRMSRASPPSRGVPPR